jgi:hypothetical protein
MLFARNISRKSKLSEIYNMVREKLAVKELFCRISPENGNIVLKLLVYS